MKHFSALLLIFLSSTTGRTQPFALDIAMQLLSDDHAYVHGTRIDPFGNVIACGSFEGIMDADPEAGSLLLETESYNDPWLAKFDPSGHVLWAFSLFQESPYQTTARSIDVDQTGNVYVTGSIHGTVDMDPGPGVLELNTLSNENDCFIAKYSPIGEIIWAFLISSGGGDEGHCIRVASDLGRFVVTGSIAGGTDLDPGPATHIVDQHGASDLFVAEYDLDGNFQWAFSLGDGEDDGLSNSGVDIDEVGNVYLTANFQGNVDMNPGTPIYFLDAGDQSTHQIVAAYTNTGEFRWAILLGSINPANYSFPGSSRPLMLDRYGSLMIAGGFIGTIDFDGTEIAQNLFHTGYAAYCARYDTSGALIRADLIGAGPYSRAESIAQDSLGRIWMIGVFDGTVDLDPTGGVDMVSCESERDGFLAVYDTSGQCLGGIRLGGDSTYNQCRALDVAPNGKAMVGGSFSAYVDADPGPGTWPLFAGDTPDAFLLGFTSTSNVGLNDLRSTRSEAPWPIPAHDRLYLPLDVIRSGDPLTLWGADGRIQRMIPPVQCMDISDLSNGVYWLRGGTNGSWSAPFIKY
jgi:hypothetical protein